MLLFTGKVPSILFCQLGVKVWKRKWIRVEYGEEISSLGADSVDYLQRPTCFNGDVYALCLSPHFRRLVQVKFVFNEDEAFVNLSSVMQVPYSPVMYENLILSVHYHLKRHGCELFVIEVGLVDEKTVADVSVFRLDWPGVLTDDNIMITKKLWHEKLCLAHTAFFVDIARDLDDALSRVFSSVYKGLEGNVFAAAADRIFTTFNFRLFDKEVRSFFARHKDTQALVWALADSRCAFSFDTKRIQR